MADTEGIALLSPGEVAAIRRATGLSVRRFAALVGCAHASVSRWERGVASPSRSHIRRIRSVVDRFPSSDVSLTR